MHDHNCELVNFESFFLADLQLLIKTCLLNRFFTILIKEMFKLSKFFKVHSSKRDFRNGNFTYQEICN